MIPAPKDYLYPSDVVEMLLIGYEPDSLNPPTWAKAYLSGAEADPNELEFLVFSFIEIQIGHLCQTGLYAWQPGENPVMIYKGMMHVSCSYPDCLFFSALTNIIRANYDCQTAQKFGEIAVDFDDRKAQFLNSELSSIDIHMGKHALFREDLVHECLAELLEGVQLPHVSVRAREQAKKILGRKSDPELAKLGRKRAVKILERNGFSTSLSTAARALKELKAERGLS